MISQFLPQGSRRRELARRLFLEPKIPAHISTNFINLKSSELVLIKQSLANNFFSKESHEYLSTQTGNNDLMDHLTIRLENDRKYAIPWLDNAKPLRNAKILEIGCGTGCSTVALAEQGAHVTAIDIDEKALVDARTRCNIYGLDVNFHQMNATEIRKCFSKDKFDFVIFWACLEHMTHDERMITMKATWNMLPLGSFWCITDSPNRLWFYDAHTAQMPYYLWLPDDLAVKYSRFSAREKYRSNFTENRNSEEQMRDFLRWGRGISFHEFDLTIKPVKELNIVSSMTMFHRRQRMFRRLRWKFGSDSRYEVFLHNLSPDIHGGFFQPNLDLIIEKD